MFLIVNTKNLEEEQQAPVTQKRLGGQQHEGASDTQPGARPKLVIQSWQFTAAFFYTHHPFQDASLSHYPSLVAIAVQI